MQLGMSMFLKNITLYGIYDLLNVVNSSIETKNYIKQLVENGIKNKIVSRLYDETTKNALSTK